MKKKLTLLTGTVLLIAMLVTCGCSNEDTPLQPPPNTVIIHVKAVKIDGKKHLEMYDSNDQSLVVVDTLVTLVKPGDTVVWVIEYGWRLRKIDKIGREQSGNIIVGNAELIPDTKNFELIIPEDAQAGTEKYDISCKGWLMSPWGIDPHLKIPPGPGTE